MENKSDNDGDEDELRVDEPVRFEQIVNECYVILFA